MSDDKNEEYKGPGKFTAGLGRGVAEDYAGVVGGGAVGAVIGAALHNTRAGAIAGAALGGTAGFIDGAIRGAHNAGEGKRQYKAAQSELEKLKERDALRATIAEASKGRG